MAANGSNRLDALLFHDLLGLSKFAAAIITKSNADQLGSIGCDQCAIGFGRLGNPNVARSFLLG